MADYNGLNADRVIEQIAKFRGNIAMCASALHCSRTTVYNYIHKHTTVKQALDEARETMIDNVESKLYSSALEGEAWAVCFFLKTQAKHRGYVERQEVSGKDGDDIIIKVVYDRDSSTPPETA